MVDSQWLKVPAKDVPKDMEYFGLVYVIEYGGKVKIGQSRKFLKRLMAFRKEEKYGGATIGTYRTTPLCTNYKEIEKYLHKYFANKRVGRIELFDISLKEFLEQVPELEFLDESSKLEALVKEKTEFLKKLLFRGKANV